MSALTVAIAGIAGGTVVHAVHRLVAANRRITVDMATVDAHNAARRLVAAVFSDYEHVPTDLWNLAVQADIALAELEHRDGRVANVLALRDSMRLRGM